MMPISSIASMTVTSLLSTESAVSSGTLTIVSQVPTLATSAPVEPSVALLGWDALQLPESVVPGLLTAVSGIAATVFVLAFAVTVFNSRYQLPTGYLLRVTKGTVATAALLGSALFVPLVLACFPGTWGVAPPLAIMLLAVAIPSAVAYTWRRASDATDDGFLRNLRNSSSLRKAYFREAGDMALAAMRSSDERTVRVALDVLFTACEADGLDYGSLNGQWARVLESIAAEPKYMNDVFELMLAHSSPVSTVYGGASEDSLTDLSALPTNPLYNPSLGFEDCVANLFDLFQEAVAGQPHELLFAEWAVKFAHHSLTAEELVSEYGATLPEGLKYVQNVLRWIPDEKLLRVFDGETKAFADVRAHITSKMDNETRLRLLDAVGMAWNRLLGFVYFQHGWSPTELKMRIETVQGNIAQFQGQVARQGEEQTKLEALKARLTNQAELYQRLTFWQYKGAYFPFHSHGEIEAAFTSGFPWRPVQDDFDFPHPGSELWGKAEAEI